MAGKWYRSDWAKGILFAAAALAFTLSVCLGVYLFMQAERNDYDPSMDGADYLASRSLADDMQEDYRNLAASIAEQGLLEEKTADGEDRVIDLQSALDMDGAYTYENVSGLAYRVSDLKKWAQSGWQYYGSEADENEKVIVCHRPDGKYDYFYYGDFVRMLTNGKLKFLVPDSRKGDVTAAENQMVEILETLRSGDSSSLPTEVRAIADADGVVKYVDFWNYGWMSVKQKYNPQGAESLLKLVNESEAWNGRLSEALTMLDVVLQNYEQALTRLQKLEELREGNTNITYLYRNSAEKIVRTNRAAYEDDQAAEKFLSGLEKQGGVYILIRPLLSQCSTTLNTDIQQWQEIASQQIGHDQYAIALQIDPAFPVADAYARKAQQYNRFVKLLKPLAAGMVFLALVFAAGAVWLTLVSGRWAADEELHLSLADKWFTELFLAGILADGVLFAAGMRMRLQYAWEGPILLDVGLMAAAAASVFLLLYLSLARRIKAKLLWRNSLTRCILQKAAGFGKVYMGNLPGSLRITLAVCGYFLLMVYAASAFEEAGAFLVLATVCAAVLVICVYRAGGQKKILEGLRRIAEGELQYKISQEGLVGEQKSIAEYINRVGDGLDAAVEKSLKNERMQTELITNVSHDIKTPLTSIINYVDLLKRENLDDPKAREYIGVLEKKAQRLKVLAEDVVEASRVSTGNITLNMGTLDFLEMTKQAVGEFQEKFERRDLQIMTVLPSDPVLIRADGQRLWRVLENILNNAAKYAMEGTRVYVELQKKDSQAVFSIKNISAQPLNFSADELTERFIRGDVARNTEGSGLGLSIAKSLTELQEGVFRLYVDGDLFRVTITFPSE